MDIRYGSPDQRCANGIHIEPVSQWSLYINSGGQMNEPMSSATLIKKTATLIWPFKKINQQEFLGRLATNKLCSKMMSVGIKLYYK